MRLKSKKQNGKPPDGAYKAFDKIMLGIIGMMIVGGFIMFGVCLFLSLNNYAAIGLLSFASGFMILNFLCRINR